MPAASQPHSGTSSGVEFSGSGQRLPIAPDGASSHVPVKSAELKALSDRLEKLSAWALDVRRLPSGRVRADLSPRQPEPPKAGTRIVAETIRPSARARKLATALRRAQTAREEQQVQAVAAAMQQPVHEASKQIIGRMAELENTLVPKPPRRKPPSHVQASASSRPASQEFEIGELDRGDLGENGYQEVFVSPRTALFQGFDNVTGAAQVVAKMKMNHEATKGDRSEDYFTESCVILFNEMTLTAGARVLRGAALWIGGIPDYIAGRGLQEELEALFAPFGKLEHVKVRYKPPGAEATRLESWMGGSWGLVTFATKAACENAKTQGVRVPIKEPPSSKSKQPVETGCLMIKVVDKKLAAASPIGRLAAEQHVARMERALRQYKQFVRANAVWSRLLFGLCQLNFSSLVPCVLCVLDCIDTRLCFCAAAPAGPSCNSQIEC